MSNTWSEKYTYTSYREGKKKDGGSLLWCGLGVSREGLSKEVVFKAEAEWGGGLTRQGREGCNEGISSAGKVWTAGPAKPKSSLCKTQGSLWLLFLPFLLGRAISPARTLIGTSGHQALYSGLCTHSFPNNPGRQLQWCPLYRQSN